MGALDQELAQELAAWEARGLTRREQALEGLVDLVTNDYLNLAQDPHLIEASAERRNGTARAEDRRACWEVALLWIAKWSGLPRSGWAPKMACSFHRATRPTPGSFQPWSALAIWLCPTHSITHH